MPSVLFSARRRGVAAALLAASAVAAAGCSAEAADDPASRIARTTTAVASAPVMSIERDTSAACPEPAAPDFAQDPEAEPGWHPVVHAAGEIAVPDDPQRVVALDAQSLDAVCALGLWDRLVAAGPERPAYLGSGIAALPLVSSDAEITALSPDLVLASSPDATSLPAVILGDGPDWRTQFLIAGAALGRFGAAEAALAEHTAQAEQAGRDLSANLSEVSLVRFTADSLQIEGVSTLAGRALAEVSAARPPAQRAEESAAVSGEELSSVDGDVIFVLVGAPGDSPIWDGTATETSPAVENAQTVMRSDAWRKLGAAADSRVFVAPGDVWDAKGLTAARAVLADLRAYLNAYA